MALKEPFMVKCDFDLDVGEAFKLTAETGESLLVKDIFVWYGNAEYGVISIDRDTVGFFRLNGHMLKSHLRINNNIVGASYSGVKSVRSNTLLSLMINRGYFRGFPVAEGQTFTVMPYPSDKKLGKVMVIYEMYDAGDIKKEDINGSEAKEYIYVAYGRISEEVKNAGEYVYDVIVNPEEFSDFPFERECPAKTEVELLGILGWEAISIVDADNYTNTKYLKIFKGRKMLFDKQKNGLPLYQHYISGATGQTGGKGFSLMGQYTESDYRPPLLFDKPIKFTAGEELRFILQVDAVGSGNAFDNEFLELGLILRSRITE